jgi:hypothetical protein
MKRRIAMGLYASAMLACLTCVPLRGAQADEFDVSTGHLKLQYSILRTGSPLDLYEGQCLPVIDRLWFDCPGKRGSTCTVAVTLSLPYGGLTPGWNLALGASIDGHAWSVRPVGALTVAYTADHLAGDNAATMTLVAPEVARGVHVLDVCLYLAYIEATEPGMVTAQRHTVKIEVYKP